MLRILHLALFLMTAAVSTMAGRNALKPSDFEPLTSLPWKKPGATLDGVLDAIFRETNPAIRYPVLAEYLRTIPSVDLGKAFERCIDLGGTQTPDRLVTFFLPIWAKRDPTVCWKRTKELFRLVGIDDWLEYDSWKQRPRITVQDLGAIRASRFWLNSRDSLMSFPLGVNASSLPRKERIRMMKGFADVWMNAFGSWPGYPLSQEPQNGPWTYPDAGRELIKRFADTPDSTMMSHVGSDGPESEAEFEIAARRWLQAEPASALKVIKQTQEKQWPPFPGQMQPRAAGPSIELLMVWAKIDLTAIVGWVNGLDIRKDAIAVMAKGLLLSRVDAATRDRWFADAKSVEEEQDWTDRLLSEWARWDPKAALAAAVATKNAATIREVAIEAAAGYRACLNARHYSLGVVKDFDVASLPGGKGKGDLYEWEVVLEYWGDVDIGGTARYGADFLFRTDYAPRENLIKFFSGDDVYPDEECVIDRTFCALRVWAVVKPREMKAWIGTLKDAEMRKALTWLLQHPWGTGPKE